MARNHWERFLPGEKGAKGEMGEPGIGERGEPGPAGPIGNSQTYFIGFFQWFLQSKIMIL